MKVRTPKPTLPPLLKLVCRALDDKKAGDIRVLCVSAQSSITDYMVIATGTSDPHLRALRVEMEKVIDAAQVRIVGMDSEQGSGWLVIDAFDVMIHVFTPETRERYGLENLWKDGDEVTVATILAEPKPKARKKASVPPKKRKPRKPSSER